MKKIISLLLVIILALSLTGCLFAPAGYEYDEEGRVTRRPYSQSSYMTIEYDASGNKALETVYTNSDNVKEQAIHYENGIKSFIQDYDDNGTVGSERYYNSKEEEIRIVYYVDGTFNGSEDKEYDEHGNIVLISRRDENNDEWESIYYEYNENNDCIREDVYRFGEAYYVITEYHTPGVIKSIKTYTSSGIIKQEDVFNESGKASSSTVYSYDNEVQRIYQTVVFNSNNSTVSTYFLFDGRKIVSQTENTNYKSYYYNADGSLEATYSHSEGLLDANGTAMDISHFEFSSDWSHSPIYPD
ncbi:MAG: hypothetical protein E7315_00575 [Clostridiales bacterium]|nr:hypothetical protein [Clostridiales bacterium]